MKGTIAGMSSKQVAQLRKRCVDILANPSSYDRSLAQLCQMIRMASR